MKITFFGVRGIYPPGAQTSCTLVELDDHTVVIDLGSTRLFDDPARIQRIDLLLLSHLHRDHAAQLPRFLEEHPACPLIAPEPIPGANQLNEVIFPLPGLRVETFVTNHAKRNYAFKLTYASRVAVWTGDASYEPALAEFCRGADAIICEASNTEVHRDYALRQGHMCPSLFTQLMTEAQPKLAIATHFVEMEPDDFLQAIRTEALIKSTVLAAQEQFQIEI